MHTIVQALAQRVVTDFGYARPDNGFVDDVEDLEIHNEVVVTSKPQQTKIMEAKQTAQTLA
jgi:hypothetical protein